jgi:hypothetical protein
MTKEGSLKRQERKNFKFPSSKPDDRERGHCDTFLSFPQQSYSDSLIVFFLKAGHPSFIEHQRAGVHR